LAETGALKDLLELGVADGVAPAMVLGLWRDGRELAVLAAGAAGPDTVFDLASLTKPLATAALCLEMAAAGRLPWDTTLGHIYGAVVPAEKRDISIRQLLCHASGLEAYQPYYTALGKLPVTMRAGLLKAMLMNQPLVAQPGQSALYSDLGYLLLGLIVQEAAGMSLDQALDALYQRAGIDGPRYAPRPAPPPWPLTRVAPCGPLPGRPRVHGRVEDENAHALGGVAGHAGLFGTAGQVAAVMLRLVEAAEGRGPWPAELAGQLFDRDADTPGSTRTPGFDTPSGQPSAAGDRPPDGLVGHLGFTGVSLWWHRPSNSGVVLLTNRVALGRDNDQIKQFRPRVHELAWPVLGL